MATAVPLSGWADRQLRALAEMTESDAVAALSGGELLTRRAVLGGFRIPGRVSAGGGCRFYEARDGHVALNLSRPDDRALLPALFGDPAVDAADESDIAARFLGADVGPLVAQGRMLGMAIAGLDEPRRGFHTPTCLTRCPGRRRRRANAALRVVDLSALWAGPLASHLLHQAGAEVVKVESPSRPDAMRGGDSAFFASLHDGKELQALDLRAPGGREALLALIRRTDIVIEAARPRALLQLGIDADALVAEVPGLIWATITGHGAAGDAANWVGFGDDTAVAGGLSAALRDVTGKIGFVGDAIGDPLTGIYTARQVVGQRAQGKGGRLFLSMAAVVAEALVDERARDEAAFTRSLESWTAAAGQAFAIC